MQVNPIHLHQAQDMGLELCSRLLAVEQGLSIASEAAFATIANRLHYRHQSVACGPGKSGVMPIALLLLGCALLLVKGPGTNG